jgi:hypothetical protein
MAADSRLSLNVRVQYFLTVQALTLKGRCGSFFLVQWPLILAITKRAFPANSGRTAQKENGDPKAAAILDLLYQLLALCSARHPYVVDGLELVKHLD